MKLTTPVNIPVNKGLISHRQKILLMGSCFAEEMGKKMQDDRFDCIINPFGVLYNPRSILSALQRMLSGVPYTNDELIVHKGLWHSMYHHSSLSDVSPEKALRKINTHFLLGSQQLQEVDVLVVTWGTNRCYLYEGNIVGNCHKMPEKAFQTLDFTIEQIVEDYTQLFDLLFVRRPEAKVILTVSPIRYVKYGLHESQLSKATLLMAADKLQKQFPQHVIYFPAYEILMDELRDYRFYADDLVHPSTMAVQYVYERFMDCYMTTEEQTISAECRKLSRDLQHRPLHPDSPEYLEFKEKSALRIQELKNKYPYLNI